MAEVGFSVGAAAPGGVLGRSRFSVSDLPVWSAAVRTMQAGGREARLLCIGDSVTQGFGGVSGGWTPNGRAGAWPERLAALMSGRGLPTSAASVAGAGAADGASGGYSAYDPRVTLGAGWGVNALTGMGGKLFSGAAASGGVWSFQSDGPVDRFDLWAVTNTALGVMTVETDGVVRATVNTTRTAAMEVTTVAFPETSGPVTVRWVSGGAVFIAGGVAWRSDVRRARGINAGWGGAKVADWITTDQPYRAYGSIPAAAPDLSVVCVTINDWNAGTAVAAYKAGLGLLVDRPDDGRRAADDGVSVGSGAGQGGLCRPERDPGCGFRSGGDAGAGGAHRRDGAVRRWFRARTDVRLRPPQCGGSGQDRRGGAGAGDDLRLSALRARC